jgi:multiple sugar transport system substrate-binding protein
VHSGGDIFGLPMDSGPMALFYNKDVFDKYGVKVPTTWQEYLEAARKIHKADPRSTSPATPVTPASPPA